MEWGTPVKWGKFLLFCVTQSVKTKETNTTRPGSPTPCKQALNQGGRENDMQQFKFNITMCESLNDMEISHKRLPRAHKSHW